MKLTEVKKTRLHDFIHDRKSEKLNIDCDLWPTFENLILTVTFDLLLKNFNVDHNFFILWKR